MAKSKITKTDSKSVSAKPKTKEELKFEIDQLRKDKIIYALESISCSMAVLLFLISISIYFPRQNVRFYYNLAFSIALGYWLFTVYGNTQRLIKIKKLEKEMLKGKKK